MSSDDERPLLLLLLLMLLLMLLDSDDPDCDWDGRIRRILHISVAIISSLLSLSICCGGPAADDVTVPAADWPIDSPPQEGGEGHRAIYKYIYL